MHSNLIQPVFSLSRGNILTDPLLNFPEPAVLLLLEYSTRAFKVSGSHVETGFRLLPLDPADVVLAPSTANMFISIHCSRENKQLKPNAYANYVSLRDNELLKTRNSIEFKAFVVKSNRQTKLLKKQTRVETSMNAAHCWAALRVNLPPLKGLTSSSSIFMPRCKSTGFITPCSESRRSLYLFEKVPSSEPASASVRNFTLGGRWKEWEKSAC